MPVLREATVAVFYTFFAGLFVWVNLEAQGTNISSAIMEAVVLKYDSYPWSFTQEGISKFVTDVNSPADLYKWLTVVFATVTYFEQPVSGRSPMFCTEESPCQVAEGNCDNDQQCVGDSTCGDKTASLTSKSVNGGSYVDTADLVDWCEWMGTPVDLLNPAQDCSVDGDLPGKPQCCWSPLIGDYVRRVESWISNEPILTGNCPDALPDILTCCAAASLAPDVLNETQLEAVYQETLADQLMRPATVGSFNQMLLVRVSIKRFKMKDSTNVFKTAVNSKGSYNRVSSAGDGFLSAEEDNGLQEDKRTWTSDVTGATYEYQSGAGYAGAGAYVTFIDPRKGGEAAMRRKLSALMVDGWFDAQLATFTLDYLIYNGNVDKYMHAAHKFSLDGVGSCDESVAVNMFNLNLYNFDYQNYFIRYAVEQFLLCFVLFFVFIELRKIFEVGFFGHFRNGGAFVDLVSLSLCLSVLLTNYMLQGNPLMADDRVLDKFADAVNWPGLFKDLEAIAAFIQDQNYIIAINLFVVFVRMVALLAQLQSNLGLILKVLDKAFYNMAYFLATFLMVMLGFVFFSFFTFGTRFMAMSTIMKAFFQVFGMLLGVPVYDQLLVADAVMAPVFFYVFYILFYLVMKNMFVSILMTGYDFADHEMKKAHEGGGREVNPFIKIKDGLKADIATPMVRCVTATSGVIMLCATPLKDCVVGCLGPCIPSKSPFKVIKDMLPKKLTASSRDDVRAERKRAADAKGVKPKEKGGKDFRLDCSINFFFLINFMLFVFFQTRGSDSFTMAQATYYGPRDKVWVSSNPMRKTSFYDITSFEEVVEWAKDAVVGRPEPHAPSGSGLYSSPFCATVNGAQEVQGVFVPAAACDNAKDDQQLVNKVSDWNIGFMNTTFVRLSIQAHCFQDNDNMRVKKGYPVITVNPNSACSSQDCSTVQTTLAAKGTPCLNSAGVPQNFDMPLNKPGELGPYSLLGGYAVSLGVTAGDALRQIETLEQANVFTKDTASMVFDFITYNGNMDMFMHSSVHFNLLPTGKFEVFATGQAFPMNFGFDGGGGFEAIYRMINLGLFCVYAILVVGFLSKMFSDMGKEFHICRAEGKPSYLFLKFYFSNVWNISDTLSMALSVTAIINLLQFVLNPFRKTYIFSVSSVSKYIIPNPMVDAFKIVGNTDPLRPLQEDWFIFSQFETCVAIYGTFLSVAGVNSFFIAIKVVKFVGQLQKVKVFSNTLGNGFERIFYFTVIILLLLCGFALFYTILFGAAVPFLASFAISTVTLFDWMVGKVDLDPLIAVAENLAIISFVIFMIFFYFIAVNMYLATMMNTYSQTVGAMDVEQRKKEVEAQKKIRVVEYEGPEDMKADFKFGRENDLPPDATTNRTYFETEFETMPEVVVTHMTKDGKAATFNVGMGHYVYKVNGDRYEWRKFFTIEDMMEKGILIGAKDGKIRVTFKDPDKDEGYFGKIKNLKKGLEAEKPADEGVQATVKNFWRTQGAVTWVHTQIANAERAEEQEKKDALNSGDAEGADEEEDEEGMGDEGEDEKEAENGGDKGGGVVSKSSRVKAKKRIESLLFSRWPAGRTKKASSRTVMERGKGEGPDPAFEGSPGVAGSSQQTEKDLDFDTLKDKVEEMNVTGEETWLDCLMTQIEKETDEESIITEVLRTSEMSEGASKKGEKVEKKPWEKFYENANAVLLILEYKARKQYYKSLQNESETRQQQLNKQNQVLHDYVWELEREFTNIMVQIHEFKTKKQSMLKKLAGLLDKAEYKEIAGDAPLLTDLHMERLTTPWPVARAVPQNALKNSPPAGR